MLADRDRADEAVEVLRGHADADWLATDHLTYLLVKRGETGAAVEVLRVHAYVCADEYERRRP